jgi:2-haloacid dehalogenase
VRFTDYQALSFDCYGTLINWEAGIAAVLSPWAKSRGLTLNDEQLLTAYSTCEATAEAEHPADPYPGSDQDAAALATSVPDWPAFADSHDALEALSQHFKLIILSNVDRASFAASNTRLGVEFTSILTAQDIGSYKPSPRNFTALIQEARRLGIGDGKLLHVAQSLFHDHVPAQQAGLPTVWINRRHDRPGWGATPAPPADVSPDAEFPSMAAFAAAVQAE